MDKDEFMQEVQRLRWKISITSRQLDEIEKRTNAINYLLSKLMTKVEGAAEGDDLPWQ